MSNLDDKAQAGSSFGALSQKRRNLLTEEERKLLALGKAAAQARLASDRAGQAAATSAERAKAADAEAKAAADAFTSAGGQP